MFAWRQIHGLQLLRDQEPLPDGTDEMVVPILTNILHLPEPLPLLKALYGDLAARITMAHAAIANPVELMLGLALLERARSERCTYALSGLHVHFDLHHRVHIQVADDSVYSPVFLLEAAGNAHPFVLLAIEIDNRDFPADSPLYAMLTEHRILVCRVTEQEIADDPFLCAAQCFSMVQSAMPDHLDVRKTHT